MPSSCSPRNPRLDANRAARRRARLPHRARCARSASTHPHRRPVTPSHHPSNLEQPGPQRINRRRPGRAAVSATRLLDRGAAVLDFLGRFVERDRQLLQRRLELRVPRFAERFGSGSLPVAVMCVDTADSSCERSDSVSRARPVKADWSTSISCRFPPIRMNSPFEADPGVSEISTTSTHDWRDRYRTPEICAGIAAHPCRPGDVRRSGPR